MSKTTPPWSKEDHLPGTNWRVTNDKAEPCRIRFDPEADKHRPYVCMKYGSVVHKCASLYAAQLHMAPLTDRLQWVKST